MMKKRGWALLIALLVLTAVGCTAMAAQQSVTDSAQNGSTVILLDGSIATVEGTGAAMDGNILLISEGGSYTLSGTLNGQIIVNAGKKDAIELVLNGVSITSVSGAAICIEQADETYITLAEGTQNMLADASDDTDAIDTNAALFAKDSLIIRGNGSLMVYGNDQNGVAAKDDLVIEGGSITIQAKNNGLLGKDSVTVQGGTLTITAGNDGIQSDTKDEGKGTILIEGGSLSITSGHDALQAEALLTITGGTIDILAGGGYDTATDSYSESYKALKAAGDIVISGGTISANSLDDALHASENVTVTGGELTLFSGDDGIHADQTVNLSGGTVNIRMSYEGIEGTVINLDGGSITLFSTDDGINAADSAQSAQDNNRGMFGGGNSSLQVNVTGGVIRVNAYGDGIDSNGIVTMTGGELYVSGPVSSGNGALDYDRSFSISGGILAAAGSTGMAQTPDTRSSQPSVIVYFDSFQTAGNTYLLTDTNGNVLIRYTPDKEFQCIVFSAPEMQTGSTYAVYQSADGTMNDAVQLYEFTVSGTVASVGETAFGQMPQSGPMRPNDGAPQNGAMQPNDEPPQNDRRP